MASQALTIDLAFQWGITTTEDFWSSVVYFIIFNYYLASNMLSSLGVYS